ncbi:MAG: DNA polymerase III subunit delta [Betaproteobacteria bacterium]
MRIKAPELQNQLVRKLAPVYAIHGDELLLAFEAADAIRAAARKNGFGERVVLDVVRNFDWSELAHAGASQSLFGDRKIVELRFGTGKIPAAAAHALVAWCQRPNPDVLLVVSMPKLEGYGWWDAEWFRALDRIGVIVDAESVPRASLPGWLRQRFSLQHQSPSAEALEFLAAQVEGNLLAARQEVQKLALAAPEGELSLEVVQDAVANVARYNPHKAAEALVTGDVSRYTRILDGLRGEGESEVFLLGVISGTLFSVKSIGEGVAPKAAFTQHRVFDKALQRVLETSRDLPKGDMLDDAIATCAEIDRCIKGVGERDPWEGFTTLGLKLAGGSKG